MEKHISEQFLQAKDMPSLKKIMTEICSQYNALKQPDIFLDQYAGGYRATCRVKFGNSDIQRAALACGGTVFAVNYLLFNVDLPDDFDLAIARSFYLPWQKTMTNDMQSENKTTLEIAPA